MYFRASYCRLCIGKGRRIIMWSICRVTHVWYFVQYEVTPLMEACEVGSAATVRVLLDHGANPDLCREVRILNMYIL